MDQKTILRISSALLTGALLIPVFSACKNSELADSAAGTDTAFTDFVTNTSAAYPTTPQVPAVKNLSWSEGEIFPTFPAGSGELDVIMADDVTDEEKITLTCLQGLVNAKETRFALYVDNVEHGQKFTDIKPTRQPP